MIKNTEGQDVAIIKTHHAPAERLTIGAIRPTSDRIKQDELLQTMLDGYPEVAVILNAHRQIIACNQGLLDLLGITAVSRVLGKRFGEVFQCTHSRELEGGCGTAEACQTCGSVNALLACQSSSKAAHDVCHISSEGAQGPKAWDLDVTATPIVFKGEPLLIFAARDISAATRRDALEQLFFHDTLNVAGGIQGLAELLGTGESFDPVTHPQRLSALSRQLVEQIQAQRDLAAAERGELEPRWSTVVVPELFDDLRATYEAHHVSEGRIVVFVPPPESCGAMQSDRVLLNRVLGNLIKNALEASRPGQTVTVSCEPGHGDRVKFSVNNETVMPREIQLQVFNRSFSTKGGSGRGLGTFSVKLLSTRYLRGHVEFHSDDVSGTTFCVDLDRAQTPDWVAPIRASSREESDGRLEGLHVLLAEDSRDNQRLVTHFLKKAGAAVSVADDGKMALDVAMEAHDRGEPFDVILMDIEMPRMNGYESTRALRRNGYAAPIVALTAHSTARDRNACREAGCDDYVCKPVNRNVLIETVSRHCEGRRSVLGCSVGGEVKIGDGT